VNPPSMRTRFRRRRYVQADISRYIELLRSSAIVGLHLGCGGHLIPGLINCDLYDPAADRKVGICDLSEFAAASVDYLEANHVIEHLSFAEAEQAVSEWSRVVCTGGRIVVSCPDMDRLVRRWLRRPGDRWTDTIRMIYGSQEHGGMFHKSGYNSAKLASLLSTHGFVTELSYTPYPPRPTPSLCVIAIKN
jgi:predicted SAM-dependent methyltransferase